MLSLKNDLAGVVLKLIGVLLAGQLGWMMAGAYGNGVGDPPPDRDVRPVVEAFYEVMNC